MLTYGLLHFTDDTMAPTYGKRSVTYQTVTKPFFPLSMGSFLGPSGHSCLLFFISHSRPEWALWLVINSVIQGVDSCSRVSVCSQACCRDGPCPSALCLLWSLNRLEVNGGPCVEVAGAWMEPPLTRHSHTVGGPAPITVTLVSVGPH